jgi:hypothetical protein
MLCDVIYGVSVNENDNNTSPRPNISGEITCSFSTEIVLIDLVDLHRQKSHFLFIRAHPQAQTLTLQNPAPHPSQPPQP